MNTLPHILIVDDEPDVRLVLKRLLEPQYQVDTAANGTTALRQIASTDYDLLLLDLNLGDISGLEVLQAAKEKDEWSMVIILTAYGALDSAVNALRMGAFDYIFKPAPPDLLRQRVAEGLQRRNQILQQRALLAQIATLKKTLQSMTLENIQLPKPDETRFLRAGPLVIDRYHRSAMMNGKPVNLTTAELDVLICLVQASPEPVAPQELVQCAMGYQASLIESRELIKWHIHRLRRKLEPDPSHPHYLKTVRSRGYLWVGDPNEVEQ